MTRIASALNSDDLTHEDQACDVDTVRALGLTAINRPLGVLIIEAMEACAGDGPDSRARIRELTEAVRGLVQAQSARQSIKVNFASVADLIVRELVLDRCSRCGGRGFLPLAYGPDASGDLTGEDCPTCLGSGRARRDFKGRAKAAGLPDYSRPLDAFWEAVEGRLAEAEMDARWQVKRRFWE